MFFDNFICLCNSVERSPSAVAEEMGYQRSVVTRWSKGAEPRQATLQKIADYFGVSVEELTSENPQQGLTDIQRKLWELVKNMDDDTARRFIAVAEAMLS